MPTLLGIQDEGAFDTSYVLPDDKPLRKTFSITYSIKADNHSQREGDIALTAGLPPLRYYMRGSYAKSYKIKEVNSSALLWEVTVEFDSEIKADDSEDEKDPVDRTPDWSWTSETEEQVLEHDAVAININTQQPLGILNSVEEPLFTTTKNPMAVLNISRLETVFDSDTIFNNVSHVNSAPFWGSPAGTALMESINDTEEDVEGFPYRRVTYAIKFKIKKDGNGAVQSESWKVSLLDHGTKYLENFGDLISSAKPFLDANKRPTTGNLNGFGTQAADGEPAYVVYHRYPRADFNDLDLGPW